MLIPGFFIIGLSSHWIPFYFGLLLFAYGGNLSLKLEMIIIIIIYIGL